jgi:hypothetical protein
MAYIRIVYRKENYGFEYVPTQWLETLIKGDEISHFYRPAEKRWINIRLDPVRGTGGSYQGPERRKIINRPDEKVQKTGNDERNRSSNWLEDLWRDIGKFLPP